MSRTKTSSSSLDLFQFNDWKSTQLEHTTAQLSTQTTTLTEGRRTTPSSCDAQECTSTSCPSQRPSERRHPLSHRTRSGLAHLPLLFLTAPVWLLPLLARGHGEISVVGGASDSKKKKKLKVSLLFNGSSVSFFPDERHFSWREAFVFRGPNRSGLGDSSIR